MLGRNVSTKHPDAYLIESACWEADSNYFTMNLPCIGSPIEYTFKI